jgi:PPOX class probable F420-dependent enzyme
MKLTDQQKKFLLDKNFVHLATLMKDGSPQVTPVWVDFDGTHVLVNSEQKRVKVRNMKRDPRVALAVFDMANPYSFMEIRGRVVGVTTEGAADHIDKMAKKYMGQDKYPLNQPGDVRVIIKIEPEKISGYSR